MAAQVWLHTYATDGVSCDIAEYLLSEVNPDQYAALLNDPTSRVLVAEHGDSLIGFAVIRFGVPCPSGSESDTELQTLYVQEHFIGCGVGRALLEAAEALPGEHPNAVLWLKVNAQNSRAIAFYARQGYSKVGTAWFVLGSGRHENHVLIGRGTEPPLCKD